MYDIGLLSSIEFDLPTIAVGNLSVGGAGKTPHVEYLIGLLKDSYHVATLSRGYNRKTRDYFFAKENTTALEIGDEPMQFRFRFPDIFVAVGEERVLAVPQLLMDAPETEIILLDDAFQHRSIKPGYNLLISDYHRLFTRDHIVPFGRLREARKGYHRADGIIIAKCPADLTLEEKNKLIKEINPLPHQQLFFTTINYEMPYNFFGGEKIIPADNDPLMLVCGIANPSLLENYLEKTYQLAGKVIFADHHYYAANDIKVIKNYADENNIRYIITTEKDAVRLKLLEQQIKELSLSILILPIEVQFLFDDAPRFRHHIFNYIQQQLDHSQETES